MIVDQILPSISVRIFVWTVYKLRFLDTIIFVNTRNVSVRVFNCIASPTIVSLFVFYFLNNNARKLNYDT